MNLLTESQAKAKECLLNREESCSPKYCMGWIEIKPYIQREDHSESNKMMTKLAMQRNQDLQRKGPDGSQGILYLPSQGQCFKIIELSE